MYRNCVPAALPAEGGLRMPGAGHLPSSRAEDAYYAEIEREVERRMSSLRRRQAYDAELRDAVEHELLQRELGAPPRVGDTRGRGVTEKRAGPKFGFGQAARFSKMEQDGSPGPGTYEPFPG